jgi:hypothetical protein
MSAARPLRRRSLPVGGLRLDAAQSLRTGLRLPKRAGLQAGPWTARRAKGAR